MIEHEGKTYYEFRHFREDLGITAKKTTHYVHRFIEKYKTSPIKKSIPGSPRPTWCWEESEYRKVLELEREYQKGLELKKNKKPKPNTNINHAMSKGDYAITQNMRNGYPTRITGYWLINGGDYEIGKQRLL